MRYSQYLAQTNVSYKTVSYNMLTPKPVDGDPNALKNTCPVLYAKMYKLHNLED